VTPRATPPAEPRAASPGLEALGHALAAHPPDRLLARAPDADGALRQAARLLAAEARAADPVRAERLVVALRPAYGRLIEIDCVPAAGPCRALWDRLVGLCCEEFYAPTPNGP
jgi:hypothetical protein